MTAKAEPAAHGKAPPAAPGRTEDVVERASPEALARSPAGWRRLACGGFPVQAKLTVNAPGDRWEREADAVADQVLRMPEPGSGGLGPPSVQRMCAECAEHEGVQRKCAECAREEEALQAKRTAGSAPSMSSGTEARISSLRGGGRPLPKPVRSYFEPRFGRDLSGVRVHTGGEAATAAWEVRARAFTVGKDIVFGAGEWRPESHDGRRLLAHELVHTVQQGSGTASLRRYAACESAKNCPQRESGELGRARRKKMFLGGVSGPVQGLLVANFAVGSGSLKKDLRGNSDWIRYWGQMMTSSGIRWEVLGFSDCSGPEAVNERLRWERAIAVNNALPVWARTKVDRFAAASKRDCLASNLSEHGRMLNRSAFIRQTTTRHSMPPEQVTANPYSACYDGATVHVQKGGASYSCKAISGTVGKPTPEGVYCIRRQGVAQSSYIPLIRDHEKWYLIEPQFATTRFRMHLHPGSASAGCVTVTDETCFDKLAKVLNSGSSVTGTGYDGYPPGNKAGEGGKEVKKKKQSVSCVGWLLVKKGGCSFMAGSGASGSP